jgi:glucose-6-phosphate isomerase
MEVDKMTNWNNLDTLASFKELQQSSPVDLKDAMSGTNGAERVKNFQVPMAAGFVFNYAARPVDDDILRTLVALANEAQLSDKFEELYNGAVINTGEKRLVLHHLTRGQLGKDVEADGVNKRDFYVEQQKRIADFADKVHNGEIVNEKGEKFTSVVQIGIGGSDLGPRAMYIALENWAKKNGKFLMDAHFISNVDPDDASAVLADVDVAHAIFILVSKSGTTLETLTNESFVKDALKKEGLDPSKHMIAVTSETSPLAKSPDYLSAFYMDDYIGGRYSSTSAVGGAVLSLAFGPEVFDSFLKGAAAEDRLATEKDPLKNPDMLDALIGVYERNVLGYPSTAVLPYSQALSRFPAHLQQLDMESNGKSVNRFGEPVSYPTGPVLFGEPGTNGQHSFYQLLHQGTDIVPLQFIGFKKSQLENDVNIQGSTSQQKLKANVAAQIVAFACGKEDENLNKNFKGGRPSSIIVGEEVTPDALGALLAHFENKVMFQGFLWNVNSFDQEGVQLGKTLAKKVLAGDMSDALKEYASLLEI